MGAEAPLNGPEGRLVAAIFCGLLKSRREGDLASGIGSGRSRD